MSVPVNLGGPMDASFGDDFGLGFGNDNRFMAQLGLDMNGGSAAAGSTTGTGNTSGNGNGNLGGNGAVGMAASADSMGGALDFSSMMMDTASMLETDGASAGMIDFPEELNSPPNANANANANAAAPTTMNNMNMNMSGMNMNMNGVDMNGMASMRNMENMNGMGNPSAVSLAPTPAPVSAPMAMATAPTSTNPTSAISMGDAIPFPDALSNDFSIPTMPAATAPMQTPAPAPTQTAASPMNVHANTAGRAGAGPMGVATNAMQGVPMNGVNMTNVGMPTMGGGFMPDVNVNIGVSMNPMFMTGAFPVQQQMPANAAMMMSNLTPQQQLYYQHQYMQMLQRQQQQHQRQMVAMQQANAMMQTSAPAQAPVATAPAPTQQMQFSNQPTASNMMNRGQYPGGVNGGVAPQVGVPTSQSPVAPSNNPNPNQQQQPNQHLARQPWHSPGDKPLRNEMLRQIVRVLQSQRSPNSWASRLPEMARRLEEECYRSSSTREEYANSNTLQSRLKAIVHRAQRHNQARGNHPQPPVSTSSSQSSSASAGAAIPFPGAAAVGQSSNMMPTQTRQVQQPQPIPMPMELQQSSAVPQQPQVKPEVRANAPTSSQSRSTQILRQFMARAAQVTSALEVTDTQKFHNKLQSMTSGASADNASSRAVLQKQQQRLLLLRHAMWCHASDGQCTTTRFCGEMKRLWRHMGSCQVTAACSYPHCTSSKYVLSHFQQCDNKQCLVCQLLHHPVEVKENNGELMMDVDRALQQIQANQRYQAHLQAQAQAKARAEAEARAQGQVPPQVPTPSPGPVQIKTEQPVFQSQSQPQPQNSQLQAGASAQNPGSIVPPVNNMTSMNGVSGPAISSSQPSQAGNGVAIQQNMSNDGQAQSVRMSDEDRRHLPAMLQWMRSFTLEQLNQNTRKVEGFIDGTKKRVNTIMNEYWQIAQAYRATQDPQIKQQLREQSETKKAAVNDLNEKIKNYNTRLRLLKSVIHARTSAGANGVAAISQPSMNANTSMMNSAADVPKSVPQVAVPSPNAVSAHSTLSGVVMQQSPQLQQPQSFTAQLQQAPTTVNQLQPTPALAQPVPAPALAVTPTPASAPTPAPAPALAPAPATAAHVLEQSKMLQDATTSKGRGNVVGKPLDMPADLCDSAVMSKPAPIPTKPTPPPQAPVKTEPVVNPLTMRNSKLDAMMKEHQASQAKQAAQPSSEMAPTGSAAITTAVPAGDAPTSMLSELNNEDLEAHVDSLIKYYNATMTPSALRKRLEGLLKGMMDHKFGWVFSQPVDPVQLNILNYFRIIRRPMDLGTIKKKLDAGVYRHMEQFAVDVRLTFNNAMTFNGAESDVYNLARDMLNDFNAEMRKVEAEVNAEEQAARAKENACRLCGMERLAFEPAVLYCSGECNSRIRRNCFYYCSDDKKYYCCQQCFAGLPDSIQGPEGKSYRKADLTKKKNDEVHEEPWVECDRCNRWVHQICSLFNGKLEDKKPHVVKPETIKVKTDESSSGSGHSTTTSVHSISSRAGGEFLCPECLLEARRQSPERYPVSKQVFNAKHLVRTKLSDQLERRIWKFLQDEREDQAKYTNCPVEEVPTASNLTVRMVSNIEKQLMVRSKMFQRYREARQYTSEHRFKSKCICMFQEIHGVSVLLFGMYVHEFDEQEADCNARRVYISYLDSVNYFEPSHLRTKVYHELLVGYLEFVQQRGFHTAHLWACPPLKGDDYILYCHPEVQKTPKSDRLRQWYVDMLTLAQKQGVVWQITNLYDEYWRDRNTACELPYFEGDYWVGLAEEVIEKLEAEKPKKSKKASNKRKSVSTTKGNAKSKVKKPKRRKTSKGDVSSSHDADKDISADGEGDAATNDEESESADDSELSRPSPSDRPILSLDEPDKTVVDQLMIRMGEVLEPMKDDFLVVKLQPTCRVCDKPVIQGKLWRDVGTTTELGLNPRTLQTCLCGDCYNRAKTSPNAAVQERLKVLQPEDVTWPEKCTDPDEVTDSEYFDTRQAFLSLCQGNHYQFDELRRAKHSSMMALYHLGNPDPNAYVYECNACRRDILAGNRWHCSTCPDFDVCDECNAKEKHEHDLEKIPTSGIAGSGTGQPGSAAAQEQRRQREQRAKNVRLHLQLLVHSSGCEGCTSDNCDKMKELLRHGAQCKQRALGGCTICRRVWALLQLHARQCRDFECTVPRCHDLREHVRRLQMQQQLMDDRRRAAVTQHYRQMQSGEIADEDVANA